MTTLRTPKHMLICEDDPVQLKILTTLVEQAGFRTITARSSHEARTAARRWTVDAVLSDVQLQDGNAFDLVGDLRALGSEAPVFLASAFATDGMKARARTAGVKRFFEKPLNLRQVQDQVQELLQAPPRLGARVMIVDGHPEARAGLEAAAVSAGFDACSVADGAAALGLLKSGTPAIDLLLVDLHADESGGAALIRKALEVDPSLYVVMMSGDATWDEIRAGYLAGAAALIRKPMQEERLQAFLKVSLKAARRRQELERERRERDRRLAARPVPQKVARWVKSCLHSPSHSRRGRALRTLQATALSLLLGVGLAWGLQAADEAAARTEAALEHALRLAAPLQGLGIPNRAGLPADAGVPARLLPGRRSDDASLRSYDAMLRTLQGQGVPKPVEFPASGPDLIDR